MTVANHLSANDLKLVNDAPESLNSRAASLAWNKAYGPEE